MRGSSNEQRATSNGQEALLPPADDRPQTRRRDHHPQAGRAADDEDPNVETKQFFGTGGGTYTTGDGKYTETIEFFSRDDKKPGMSLEFRYDFVDGAWHHIGKSTSGEAMHEVWNRRKDLGI